MAAEECCREPRKRRERRDSGNAHERKERRPHSEERPRADTPPPPASVLHDYSRLEVERRAERLSRARRPQFGGKRRRATPRSHAVPDEVENLPASEQTVRCSSPPHFDIHQLYKHQNREENLDLRAPYRLPEEEPIRSEAAQWAPPPQLAAATDVRVPSPCPHPDKRLDKIKKKISFLKKSIAKHENEFESQNGYQITPSDRMTDVQLTRMYETLRKLQTEKRCIKTDPAEYALKVQAAKKQKERDEKLDAALKSDKSMTDVVFDIEEWLEGCRSAAGRFISMESSWTAAQLAAEKYCVQRSLLRLEAARGRPAAHSVDRGAARHLYDRYRNVKRALTACRPDAMLCNGELATIHEHEAMLFNTSVDSSSEEKDRSTECPLQDSGESQIQSPTARSIDEIPSSTSSAATANESIHNEGLHCLSIDELDKLLYKTKLQKSLLRQAIKEYESGAELQKSKKLQRDDKLSHEEDCVRYKATKAKIKLLNALINKRKVNKEI